MFKIARILKYKNDASCISNRRRLAHRAKTKGNKQIRQFLQRELSEQSR